MPNLGGWEIVIIVVVVLLLFGAKKLPDMARSVGQSARIFKGEMKGMKNEDAKGEAKVQGPAEQAPAQLPPASPDQPAQAPRIAQPEQPVQSAPAAQSVPAAPSVPPSDRREP